MKNIIIIFICIFLISFVSSTITLNSPSNNSIVYSNPVTFNSSFSSSNGIYGVNISLCQNTSGTFICGNTSNLQKYLIQDTFTYSTTNTGSSGNTKLGTKFTVGSENVTLINATWDYTGYNAILWASDFTTVLQTVTVSSYTSIHNYNLLSGNTYYLTSGTGSSYTYDTRLGDYNTNNNRITINHISPSAPNALAFNLNNIYFSSNSTNNISVWQLNVPTGKTIWNTKVCLTNGTCEYAVNNYTVNTDSIAPKVLSSYPNSSTTILANYSNNYYPIIQFNWTVNDTNLDTCWYNYNGTNITKSCTALVPILENISLNSKNNITFYENDSFGNLNITTFNWSWNYSDLTNSSINWTSLSSNMYFYEVTVCDKAGNCYTTTPERYYGLETMNYTLLINNLSRNITAELGSPILVNAHSNYGNVCLDSDHPALGVNFVCGLYDLVYNTSINWFRSTTNLVNSLFSSISNVTIQANSLDEVDNVSITLSGNATNLTIYNVNSTQIDKYFKGTFNNTSITDNTFSDFNTTKSLTLIQDSPTSVYLLMNSNASNNTLTFNMTGRQYGDTFIDTFTNSNYIFSPVYSVFKGILQTLASTNKQYIAFENFTNLNNWYQSGDTFTGGGTGWDPPYAPSCDYVITTGTMTNQSNALQLFINVFGYDCTLGRSIYANLNKSVFNPILNDNITFNFNWSYSHYPNNCGEPSSGFDAGLYYGNTRIYTPEENWYCNYGDWYPTLINNITFDISRVNSSHVNVTYDGYERYDIYIDDGCKSGRDESRTVIYNYTSGIKTFIRGNCEPAQCGGGSCTSYAYINTSKIYEVDLDSEFNAMLYSYHSEDGSGGGNNGYLYINPMSVNTLDKTNSSTYTITSQSVLNKGYNVLSATLDNVSTGNIDYYMTADGVNYEAVTSGIEHTFLSPGGDIRWKAIINASGNTNGYNLGGNASYIKSVTITTPTSYPHNITIDYGGDGSIEASYFGEVNDTRTVNLSNVSLNPKQYGTLYIGDSYLVPIKITSTTVGLLDLSNLNFVYDIGRIFLNVTSLQNYLDNHTNGYSNVTIPMTADEGQINVTSINYDFAGGNQTYYIRAHNEDYSMNITYWINNFYSRWGYNWNVPKVEFIQFSPKSPTAKNVSAYGQTNSTSIMNLTNKGYYNVSGVLGKSDLYVYIANNNLTCVNMTVNYTSIKSTSYIPYNTWVLLKENTTKGEIIPTWLYADYNCTYSTWRYFQPTLYYRFCAKGTDICSEELV